MTLDPTPESSVHGTSKNATPMNYPVHEHNVESPNAGFYNKSLRQNGFQNRNQLKRLHDRFDDICMSIRLAQGASMEKKNDDLNKALRFEIPFNIIAFMANQLKEFCQMTPEQIKKYQLMPYQEFKRLLYDVYDHRVEHAAEVNGLANNQYCALNEYVLVYMIEVYKTRKEAEHMLVELFVNLRYFYD